MPDLILASSSPYRRELLTRLRLPFESASPDIDESHRPEESAEELVRRLSASKAEALAGRYPQHLVIGSDQVAVLDGNILGKPHTPERAIQQLRDASGKSVTFLTGLALLNSASRRIQVACVPFTVHFRPSTRAASAATSKRNARWTAPAASRRKAWASACSAPPKERTPPAWWDCP
ncbi:Maf-like protein [Pseudomonas aeruginosa]|nr:Maf-like protein [Pseudomonas aeruginosa]